MTRSKVGAALTKVRHKTHGSFDQVAHSRAIIMNALRDTPNYASLGTTKQTALEDIVHKIARIVHGDHDHLDHWHDIGGYADLGANACTEAREEAARAARKKMRLVKTKKDKPTRVDKKIAKTKKAKKAAPKKPSPRPRHPLPVDPAPSTHPRPARQRRRREPEQASAQEAAE